MALSGSFQNLPVNNFGLYCTWSATQSVTGNYSDVTLNVYLKYYTLEVGSRADSTISINGTSETYTAPAINDYSSGQHTKLLKTKTVRVKMQTAQKAVSPFLHIGGFPVPTVERPSARLRPVQQLRWIPSTELHQRYRFQRPALRPAVSQYLRLLLQRRISGSTVRITAPHGRSFPRQPEPRQARPSPGFLRIRPTTSRSERGKRAIRSMVHPLLQR